ncbi:hypothetical protein TIMEGRIFFIN_23 [Bacillus phage vB_BspH_TimeGriffin]|nr:hypothetical protein TIMEGRIFFIN_23 [Bacillus phage vB_BspH_TimeGriffin]
MIQEAVYFFEFGRDGGPDIPAIRIDTYVDPIENRRWWVDPSDNSLKPLNYKGAGYAKKLPGQILHSEKVNSRNPKVNIEYHIIYYLLDVKSYAFGVYQEYGNPEDPESVNFHVTLLDQVVETEKSTVLKKGDLFQVRGSGLERYPMYRDDVLTVENVYFSHEEHIEYDDNIGKGAPMYSAAHGKVYVYDWELKYFDPKEIDFGIK